MASVQLLTAGSREGGRDPSRFPLLLLLSDTGFAVGDGHPHLIVVCAQLLGSVSGPSFCPGLHDVSLWAPRYQLSQAQSQAYLFSRRHVLAAGGWVERRGQLWSHSDPFYLLSQNSGFLWGSWVTAQTPTLLKVV